MTYELELLFTMKLYNIILVAQLEPVSTGEDPFYRLLVNDKPLVVEMKFPKEDPDQFEVERITNRRRIRNRLQYLIKWKRYSP